MPKRAYQDNWQVTLIFTGKTVIVEMLLVCVLGGISVNSFLQPLQTIQEELLRHPVYRSINSKENLYIFMQHHVFAVWDFMSLLKRLQNDLTCTTVPWIPRKDTLYARFVNEIVLGEETDKDDAGGYASHFELYLQAMNETGADTKAITRFIGALEAGMDPLEALRHAEVPVSVHEFVKHTLELASNGKTHEVAAAFFYGREDIIPDMFQSLVEELQQSGQTVKKLLYYLHRHIELDGDEHGPLAQKLLVHLCEDDQQKWAEAFETAKRSLQSRIQLWDGVFNEISKSVS